MPGLLKRSRLPRVLPFFSLLLLFVPFLPAQTAAEMDALLETEAVSFGQAARFVLVTADLINVSSAAGDAYVLAREKGWVPETASADKAIRTGELSFLIMNAFDMTGSFLYSLFPGPRYAFRELDYLGLIPGRRDPALLVPGEGLLRILSMTAAHTGRGAPEPPPVPDGQEIAADREIPPPVPSAPLREQRAEIARKIRTELDERKVADANVRIAEDGVVISLGNIQFMPDSMVLTQSEKNKLWEIADILSPYPDRKILVRGHTALAGTEAMRMQISTERARVVADFLVSLGVRRADEILIRGYGAQMALGDNATAAGQALNRRVEIILLDGSEE
jgi:outer membrane protein OmpA-like peptidoglycan-associated protein